MLVDAIRAEGFRLSKNKTALFWSLLFVPIISLAIGAVTNFVLKGSETKILGDEKMPPELKAALGRGTLDMADALVTAAGNLANPLVLLFVLIGAATLYAGDYRWETWRLISARNSRINLLLAKLAVVALLALGAMGFMLLGSVLENLIKAAVFERTLTFALTGEAAGRFVGFFGLSWLRIIQFAMMGMLAAVVTRSLLAALFVPLVVGIAQFFTPQMLGPMDAGQSGCVHRRHPGCDRRRRTGRRPARRPAAQGLGQRRPVDVGALGRRPGLVPEAGPVEGIVVRAGRPRSGPAS
jgi:ABC-2 type transport system permease protein